ncbi:hypothetical protein [Flavobacterium sp. JP2137]|uniref:hypothetical protein n=1 Tax=Flavobacterium sp. JP2137 TaxID=3414510 RepID=UPI003D300A99
MKYYLGIDPGKQGAFVLIDESSNIIEVYGMPLINKEYDKKSIKDILTTKGIVHICLEEPGIIFGTSKSSVASLYKCVGMLEGLLMGLGIPHTMAKPKEWQSEMWKNVTKQYKTNSEKKKSTDTKATSALAAINLWPNQDFRVTNKGAKSKNLNDGIIDAVLLAEYVRRNFK